MELSAEQLNRYQQQGYLQPFVALAGDDLDRVKKSVDRLLAELGSRDAYAINCYQARVSSLWDLCQLPAVLDVVEQILGPDIICWASHLFNKQAGDSRSVPWHQDAVFWHLHPAKTLTVWLAIDDADPENSALEFIPGSHTQQIPFERNDGGQVLNLQAVNPEQYGSSVYNTLRAGQFSVHHDLLLHGSKPNASERRRCGLTLRYSTPDVRVTDSAWGGGIEAILARGEDRSGYWTHHPRPLGDTLINVNGPRSVGGN